jgi:PAS domain S-box-containing protein/diguanylate cyclase (GGDEF)-like protein
MIQERDHSPINNVNMQAMIARLPCVVYRCLNDRHWTMSYLSDGCEALTGYPVKSLLDNAQLSFNDLIFPEDQEWVFSAVEAALATKTPFTHEYRIVTAQGKIKWVWEQGSGVWDTDGNLLALEGLITDITEQKETKDQLSASLGERDKELLLNASLFNEYRKAVDESSIVSKTNEFGVITYANPQFCDISGYSLSELVGKSHNLVRHPDMPEIIFEQLWNTIKEKKVWKGVIHNRAKNGDSYYVQSTVVPVLKPDGDVYEYMSIRHDITDLVRQTRRVQQQITDPLTQLPNRQKLMEDLQKGAKWKLAVFNIERFREVNEYYGLDTGDRLLVQVARLFQTLARKHSLRLYKLSGDEFGLLSDERFDGASFVEICYRFLEKLEESPIDVNGNPFNLSMVVGISQQQNYYINAEIAMNHAREHGTQLVFFDDQIDIKDQLSTNILRTQQLKEALKDKRIKVFAQPIISHASGGINKYECLVRMVQVDGSVLSPIQFLDIAKKARLYADITRAVITQSFAFFAERPSDTFSINLTLEDILNPPTMQLLKDLIQQYQIGKQLILEIVESEGIESYEEVSQFIANMQRLGCRIAIDDFGTGYSNFDYLMRLNIDIIKIDGSIIRNLDQDKNAQVVTELIVSFAQRMGIETIAEFVHSKEIDLMVKCMGIDHSQGFYHAEQLPLESLSQMSALLV